MADIGAVSYGLAVYLLMCALAVLTGRGLLRLLRFDGGLVSHLLLAPVLGQSFWTLSFGIATACGVPGKYTTWCLWAISGLLVLAGLRRPWPEWRAASWPLLLCAALPAVVMFRPFAAGLTEYTGGVTRDGWDYIVCGQNLWDHPQGSRWEITALGPHVTGNPVLRNMRYTSFALLGFLSPLVRAGDTMAVSSLLPAWGLFSLACAIWFFWTAQRQKPAIVAAITAFALLEGWTGNVVWARNFDQGLAMTYMPALAGILSLWDPSDWRWRLLLASTMAALCYTYPECGLMLSAGAGLAVLPRIWHERATWRAWLSGGTAAVALSALLLLPLVAWTSVLPQIATNLRLVELPPGQRPGDYYFEGLQDVRSQPAAWWAVGGESDVKPLRTGQNAWAIVLSVLGLAGLFVLARQRQWGVAAVAVVFGMGALYALLRPHYAYGAYKFLALGWWCLAAAAIMGAERLLGAVPTRAGKGVAVAGLLVPALWLTGSRCPSQGPLWETPYASLPASAFRPVGQIMPRLDGPVLIAVDDWLAAAMSVYYLGDKPAYFGFHPWRTAGLPFESNARGADLSEASYFLTDSGPDDGLFARPRHLIWAHGPYRLWKLDRDGGQASILAIHNANGIECIGGGHSIYLGQGDTILTVKASRDGIVHLKARFFPGPSLPESVPGHCLVSTTTAAYTELTVTTDGPQVLSLPVRAGINQVILKPWADSLARVPLPYGDRRPLLIGVCEIETSFTASSAAGALPHDGD